MVHILILQILLYPISMSRVNQIGTTKEKEESQFRVHFYIKNVFYSSDKRLPNFLQETAAAISQVVPVKIIQVFGDITKLVDLSVGIRTDAAAVAFLQSKKKIYLPGENRLLAEHEPIFSQSFKMQPLPISSFSSRCLKNTQLNSPPKQPPVPKVDPKLEMVPAPQLQLYSQSRMQSKQYSISKRSQPQLIYHSILYIFGIPLEFKEKDVIYTLSEHRIRTKYYEWKMREDMEYLFVELQQPIAQTHLFSSEIYIDKYPLLIAVKSSDETINELILRHQVQINFDKEINEIEFMKTAARVGGVISIVKDQYYGPRKYVVAFSKQSKIIHFSEQLQKIFKNVKIGKPRYPVRLCRVDKNFTFFTMMENLNYHEMELKKMELTSSFVAFD